MSWDVEKLKNERDPIREAVGLPLGVDGEFFVGHDRVQSDWHPAVKSRNTPPSKQPGLWCNWVPDPNSQSAIVWDESNHFYHYVEWLEYLVYNFFAPWEYTLDGEVHWQGENELDNGAIVVVANKVEVVPAITVLNERGTARRLRVFLCHSSDDKPHVRELYSRLLEDGIDPWLDEHSLLPGQDWEFEIRRAVKNSDIVLVCLSRKSVTKIGFVQREIKLALDAADMQPEGSIFVIPVRLEDCDVPQQLERWHWVDYWSSDGYVNLLASLRKRAAFLSSLV